MSCAEGPFRIQTPQGPRTIGYLKRVGNELVLVKQVQRRRHFFRRFAAWAMQADALPRLRAKKVARVRLEVDDGSVLEAALQDFSCFGRELDLGWGRQCFLPESFWRCIKAPRTCPRQLTIFAAGQPDTADENEKPGVAGRV